MSHQMGLGISILIGQCAESKQTTYNSTGLAKPARHQVQLLRVSTLQPNMTTNL